MVNKYGYYSVKICNSVQQFVAMQFEAVCGSVEQCEGLCVAVFSSVQQC